jgi:hypothetical protein
MRDRGAICLQTSIIFEKCMMTPANLSIVDRSWLINQK